MKAILLAMMIFFSLVPLQALRADSLQLKSGELIQGQYMGGTKAAISFMVNGKIQSYPVTKVMLLDFSNSAGPATAAARQSKPAFTAASTANSAAGGSASNQVTVPTGTKIEVRMIDTVSSQADPVGSKFQASLNQPLEVGGTVIAPKGALAYGRLVQSRQAGTLTGSSELRLELTGLTVNGAVAPISTSDYSVAGQSRGKQTAERTGIGAGLGAVIGALAGGGKGAAIGAAVGGGAGAASQVITRGKAVNVPSETVLDFSLAAPLTVTAPSAAQ